MVAVGFAVVFAVAIAVVVVVAVVVGAAIAVVVMNDAWSSGFVFISGLLVAVAIEAIAWLRKKGGE